MGDIASFSVQLVDQYGYDMNFGDVNLTVSLDDALELNLINLKNGSYICDYIPTVSGESQLKVFLDGQPIKDSPFIIFVEPGVVNSSQSLAYEGNDQDGLSGGIAGMLHQFMVQIRDRFGNLIKRHDSIQLDVSIHGNQKSIQAQTHYDTNGIWIVSYNLTISGTYDMRIQINGNDIQNAIHSISIEPSVIDGSMCTTQDASRGGLAGMTSFFKIFMIDTFGNRIFNMKVEPKIEIKLDGPESATGTVEYIGNGTYQGSYLASKSGNYQLTVRVNDKEIFGSPFDIKVEPQATIWPPNCIAFDLKDSIAGAQSGFKVQTKDYLGNNISVAIFSSEWNISIYYDDTVVSLNNTTSNLKYLHDGIYQIFYNLTKSGNYRVSVTINSTLIANESLSFSVKPNQTYAPSCYAQGIEKETVTNQHQKFQIQSMDRFHNKKHVGGDAFSISIKDRVNGEKVKAKIEDHKNGTYTVSYKIKKSGEYLMNVTLYDLAIRDSPFKIHCKWAGLPTSVIIVIVCGAALVIMIILIGIFFYRKKYKKRSFYEPLQETKKSYS